MSAPDFESLLREALAPVEPPEDLAPRLERTLAALTELAADELEAWELSAMRDPRNWARPAAAALVVGAARRARRWCCCVRAGARTSTSPVAASSAARGRPPSAR